MIQLSDFISADNVACGIRATSRKRVLEVLGDVLAENSEEVSAPAVFSSLHTRERLGSTGIGYGIAIPHGRIEGLKTVLGAFVQLESGVDFDSPDKQSVDLLFALIVPEDSTEIHLKLLAQLSLMFKDKALCDQLRLAKSRQSLHDLLTKWQPLTNDTTTS
ncbi:MAG TPA: PTS sugar transporter subunit IIA [Gammaproteobacteria bacterium]|nr:PTS sugar transporter subunit IIA [Gammaproteobacteria bacterium]